MTPVAFSSPILSAAAEILAQDDFTVRRHELTVSEDAGTTGSDGIPDADAADEVLLAEDPYFVLAAVATPSVARLRLVEPFLSSYLASRMAERPVGDKVWDGYVVLLTEERFSDLEATSSVFDLLYDTSYVRRMVSLGVRPTKSSLRDALRPFLALQRVEVREVLGDVLHDLADALATEGVERSVASQAVENFRARSIHA
jgi:hypothetical protein